MPSGLVAELLGRGRIILCLDYDGTIAPIVDDPARAWPDEIARTALAAIAQRRDRLDLAIVTGRDLAELTRLLEVDRDPILRDLFLVGVHGIETQYPDGHREILNFPDQVRGGIDTVRRWLAANLPAGGFYVEDKDYALALHFRRADPAAVGAFADAFEHFMKTRAPELVLKRGKMLLEAVPPNADKGVSVTRLIEHIGGNGTPIYFGDDLTDEDAFRAIEAMAIDGVTVKVGPGATGARYVVDSPAAVAAELAAVAAKLNR
jgi:trehalose 6-phosphate phosphatase